MSIWIAALGAVASISATYFFCVRAGTRGRCAMNGAASRELAVDRQVAESREDLRVLRAQDSVASGRVRSSRPTPPTTVERR